MKSITTIRYFLMACISLTLAFSACKKKDTTSIVNTPDETGQSSQDSRDAQSENDDAVNDINSVIGDNAPLREKTASPQATSGLTGTICGMWADTAGMNTSGSIKLNFNGTTCNNRTRTGAIRITVQDYANGKRWKQAGCIIKIEYLSYKVVRASDQRSIQLDGTQFLTNVSGGTWWELLIVKTQPTLVSTITGTNLKVTFSDGKAALYNINRKITYSIPNNILTCTAEGIGSSAGLNNLENFGITRDGNVFTSQVNTPVVWNLTCGPWAPITGNIVINVSNTGYALTGTFGVNTSGTPVTVGANQCPYGWRLDWTVNGSTHNKVFAYY